MDIAQKTVVLAEDDANDEELFRIALDRANINCHVEVVRDGEELLHYLFGTGRHLQRHLAEPPSLILLDLKLPRFNGIQVLQVLRNATRSADQAAPPVVVFTSSDDAEDIAHCYGLGAVSFVRKPVTHNHFIETVQKTVLYWLSINEPRPPRCEALAPVGAEGAS